MLPISLLWYDYFMDALLTQWEYTMLEKILKKAAMYCYL